MTAAKSREKWRDKVEISAVKDMSMYLYTIRVDKLDKQGPKKTWSAAKL